MKTSGAVLLVALVCQFDFSACGVSKSCVTKPADCAASPSSCQFGMSYRRSVEMFATNLPATAVYDSYMAVAFNGAACDSYEQNGVPCMASTPVVECSALGGQQMAAALSWNNDEPRNVRIANAADLQTAVSLSLTALRSQNGQVYCKVQQRVIGAPLNGLPNAAQVFQLSPNTKYAVLMAVGPTNTTVLRHHTAATLSATRVTIE